MFNFAPVAHGDIDFGRGVCGDLAQAANKEWLVTNGIGSFASGTIAGLLTRRYHGLLIAALKPPLGRTLLVAKLDETAAYLGREYPLFANRWTSGAVNPAGFQHIERFHLEGTTPVWTFACGDALLEKRIWMQPGANTTYVLYHLRRGSAPLALTAKALVNYRDYHGATHAGGWQMRIDPVAYGLRIVAFDGAAPFYLISDRAEVQPRHEWYRNFFLSVEAYRGLGATEDHLYASDFRATLQPGESLTLVVSAEDDPNIVGATAYAERQAHEQTLLTLTPTLTLTSTPPHFHTRLVLAADQFIVRRPTPGDPDGRTIIAGYHWFGDWGRDTMVSLPGLTLATGRPEVARSILRTFARFVDRGMLPNRFPDAGETPEYNTVDATLWYFEAMRAYHAATGDDDLVRELFPILADVVDWHRRGTRYNIHVDPSDGLLSAGEAGVQLTWMDAKVDDWVVTPRIGKTVEINALWHNALRIMADFAQVMAGDSPASEDTSHTASGDATYNQLADQVQASFARFWHAAGGYCYDVIDGPGGNDASLRPNQLFAVSLPHSPLTAERQKAVVDACARHLLTSHGLRSLAPDDPAYVGHYGGDQRRRDAAYHQGTVWGWLIGPFVSAHLRVYRDPARAQSFLMPLIQHLADHGLGNLSEIFDGDSPFMPRGCIAQAWSVAEALRAWQEIAKFREM